MAPQQSACSLIFRGTPAETIFAQDTLCTDWLDSFLHFLALSHGSLLRGAHRTLQWPTYLPICRSIAQQLSLESCKAQHTQLVRDTEQGGGEAALSLYDTMGLPGPPIPPLVL